jgi:hypothetical protein
MDILAQPRLDSVEPELVGFAKCRYEINRDGPSFIGDFLRGFPIAQQLPR